MSIKNNEMRNTKLMSEEEEMIKLGIKRIPLEYFQYRNFHYTNLKDAIAQAVRDQINHKNDSLS